ncbi:DUF2690 domain-containing protein [Streptomyces sp. LaPpAH-108]|uniref:DUF2690 domain-containing protein n=1 Tax=Streptomyces sp. LaPpAH-108 TaxID=1155714 RepID=UPI0003706265|nr:DUF2690 domain-containing protein [Streptomyces sp. LaPpAH-108]
MSILVGAALTAVLIPMAGSSYAASSCSGTGCDYKGPVTYGCDGDGVTKKTVSDGIMKAELRWSAKCSAGWVRGSDPYPNDNYWSHYAVIEKHSSESGQPLISSQTVTIPDGGSDWSNMLGGSNYYYRVCLRDGGTGEVVCSGYW